MHDRVNSAMESHTHGLQLYGRCKSQNLPLCCQTPWGITSTCTQLDIVEPTSLSCLCTSKSYARVYTSCGWHTTCIHTSATVSKGVSTSCSESPSSRAPVSSTCAAIPASKRSKILCACAVLPDLLCSCGKGSSSYFAVRVASVVWQAEEHVALEGQVSHTRPTTLCVLVPFLSLCMCIYSRNCVSHLYVCS